MLTSTKQCIPQGLRRTAGAYCGYTPLLGCSYSGKRAGYQLQSSAAVQWSVVAILIRQGNSTQGVGSVSPCETVEAVKMHKKSFSEICVFILEKNKNGV